MTRLKADGVPERLDDMILTDDILEPLGPIASGHDRVANRVEGGSRSIRPAGSRHEARSVEPFGIIPPF